MTQNLERLLAVAKEKERMQAEIEIAQGVQDQLYPKAPPVFESLRVLGMCDPARMVSGDYYDYQLVDGKLAIAIGDVAGKGISAALVDGDHSSGHAHGVAGFRRRWRPSMNGQRFSTARMVSELNQQLHATTSPEKYATFFFAIYDQATGLLTYTNAGHLQPVLFRDGAATPLDVNGTVVGAFPFSKYEESKLELQQWRLAGVLHRRHHRTRERIWRNVRRRAAHRISGEERGPRRSADHRKRDGARAASGPACRSCPTT